MQAQKRLTLLGSKVPCLAGLLRCLRTFRSIFSYGFCVTWKRQYYRISSWHGIEHGVVSSKYFTVHTSTRTHLQGTPDKLYSRLHHTEEGRREARSTAHRFFPSWKLVSAPDCSIEYARLRFWLEERRPLIDSMVSATAFPPWYVGKSIASNLF